ncbi:carbohydrate kinase family protein [Frankia sp. BMG5.23]|uniref:carbohydrate kinase family protein n=1 Tax=Frankia sp. BMG5.23 TaxID=683305 RepID=UPI000461E888|nr:carbohydrate kinase family protein [Frankia sp. BMG5.23]KDA44527.1 sugar kinase, ribokinase [Frankia sp. BMG5.23]
MATASGPVVCLSYLAAASLWNVERFPQANHGAEVQRSEASIAADGPMIAAVLAALDVPALVISNDIGDDAPGDQVRAWLHRNRVLTTVETVPGLATPQIVIVADDHGTRTWFPQLPGVAEALAAVDLAPLTGASFAYVDCYQLIEPAAVRAIQAARQAGVPLLVNLGGSALSPAVAAAVQGCSRLIIQTNVDDAEHETAPAVAGALVDQTGASWAVVTAGASGAVAAGTDDLVTTPAFEVAVRHTHCAGAAFSGGLVYGLLQGWPMRDSLALASASGGLRCARAHHEPMPNLVELLALATSQGRMTFSAHAV